MHSYIEKYQLKITFLTPVHISDGYDTEIIPTEYVVDENTKILHRIDFSKIKFDQKDIIDLNELIEINVFIEIRNFIQKLWKDKKEIFDESICYSMNSEDIFDIYNNLTNEDERLQLIINTFIRSNNKIFLPGSSVKGSLRTALLDSIIGNDINYDLTIKDQKKLNHQALLLEADTLSYKKYEKGFDVIKDPMKSLKVSDCIMSGEGIVKQVELFKKKEDGNFEVKDDSTNDIKMFYEILPKDSFTQTEVRFDKRFFNYKNTIGKSFSFNSVIESCKKFSSKVLEHEKNNFFNIFDSQIGQSQISALYDEINEANQKDNCFVIRLGHGSGRNSMSFNLKNKQGIEPVSRKLIKISGEYFPMGWVKVEIC